MGNSRIRTGIYSGSFNPIHIGHLALANWLCEFAELDEVWFVVTPHNPLKPKQDLLDDHFRLEMVRQAVSSYPKFRASDFEFHRPQPSYTYPTLCALREAYPTHDFSLIIGSDNWQIFPQWKNYQEIIEQFEILVYPRPNFPIQIPETCKRVKVVDAPILEISSTFIREAYKQGKDVRFFLPEAIREHFVLEKM